MTDKKRQDAILKILHYIQNGGDFATAKKMFQEEFDQVDVAEITAAERELIKQGLNQQRFNTCVMCMPMSLRVISRRMR